MPPRTLLFPGCLLRAEPGHQPGSPFNLIGRGKSKMHQRRAVIVSRLAALRLLDVVEQHVHAGIAVIVNMDVIAGIPVRQEGRLSHPEP